MKFKLAFALLISSSQLLAGTYFVTGECEKTVVPDRASLNIGVKITSKTRKEAQVKSTKIYDAVVSMIKAKKLKNEELQTQGIQLYEDFDWTNGKRIPKGFVSSLQLLVSSSDFEALSDLIPAATELGATEVGQLDLFVSSDLYRTTYHSCLSEAGLNAKAKAQAMQSGFSKKELKLQELKELSSAGIQPPIAMKAMRLSESADASGPSIEAGSQKVVVRVQAEFKD